MKGFYICFCQLPTINFTSRKLVFPIVIHLLRHFDNIYFRMPDLSFQSIHDEKNRGVKNPETCHNSIKEIHKIGTILSIFEVFGRYFL